LTQTGQSASPNRQVLSSRAGTAGGMSATFRAGRTGCRPRRRARRSGSLVRPRTGPLPLSARRLRARRHPVDGLVRLPSPGRSRPCRPGARA